MSPGKKAGDKAGTVHGKTRQQPIRQGAGGKSADDAAPAKPDFDDKEQGISPKRKAPGPDKRRRRARGAGIAAPARPHVRPEAKISNDDDDSK